MSRERELAQVTHRAVNQAIEESRPLVSARLGRALDLLGRRWVDPEFGIAELAKALGFSPSLLLKLFRKELGCTGRAYLRGLRRLAAQALLEMGGLPMWEVSARAGFRSYVTFHEDYLRWTGTTPGAASAQFQKGQQAELPEGDEAAPALKLSSANGQGGLPPSRTPGESPEVDLLKSLQPRLRRSTRPELARTMASGLRPDLEHTAQILLRKSREGCRDNRQVGVEIAELALAIGQVSSIGKCTASRASLLVEAFAAVGHSRRLAGDHLGAGRAFAMARIEAGGRPIAPGTLARLDFFEGMFCLSQRRIQEAIQLLSSARQQADLAKDIVLSARTHVGRGHAFLASLRPVAALDSFREAARQLALSDESDAYDLVSVYSSLANAHGLRSDLAAARRALNIAGAEAAKLGSRAVSCHIRWLEGLLAAAAAQLIVAQGQLELAKAGFQDLNQPVYAAIVGLDLALLYCQQHRIAEGGRLAAEALPVLRSVELDDEGVAALRLVDEANEQQRLEAALLLGLRTKLSEQLGAPHWWH